MEDNLQRNTENVKGKKKWWTKLDELLKHPYFSAVAASITTSIIVGVTGHFISINKLTDQVEVMEDRINVTIENVIADQLTVIQENVINNTNAQIFDFSTEVNEEIQEIRNEINSINNINNYNYINLMPAEQLGELIKETYQTDQTVYDTSENPVPLNLTQVIATNQVTGEKYTVPDLKDKTIIMQYNDNGEEVFFKGQFDGNGYWDKDCVINKYKDGKLTMVMDAVYESGKLKSYKQIFPYTTLSGNDVWVVSVRTIEEDKGEDARNGETLMYFRTEEYTKKFENSNVLDTDIIDVENFGTSIDLNIEGYYNGYTSNGRFNDDSATAYLVKYKPNGEVRYLYVGKIADGLPNDDSGNAWSVSWGYGDDGYYYYKGVYSDGDHDIPSGWQPMTQEEINNKVDPQKFNCSLKGLFDETI